MCEYSLTNTYEVVRETVFVDDCRARSNVRRQSSASTKIESMRRFAGIELGEDPVPDETTICRFRHLLEEHELTAQIFEEITEYLEELGLMVREGTIVDATIIKAPLKN